jgi:hypothetical protein
MSRAQEENIKTDTPVVNSDSITHPSPMDDESNQIDGRPEHVVIDMPEIDLDSDMVIGVSYSNDSISKDSSNSSGCCKFSLLDCIRHIMCCFNKNSRSNSDAESRDTDTERQTTSLVKNTDDADPYHHYEDKNSDTEEEERTPSHRGWRFLRSLRGLRYRGTTAERRKVADNLEDAFAVDQGENVVITTVEIPPPPPIVVQPMRMPIDDEVQMIPIPEDSALDESNVETDVSDDMLTQPPVPSSSPATVVDEEFSSELDNGVDTQSEEQIEEVEAPVETKDNIEVEDEIDVDDVTIDEVTVEDDVTNDVDTLAEISDVPTLTETAEDITQEEIMDPEIVKANLEVIASIQSGNKLYEDYYGRLTVDNSYMQGLSRIITRNSRTNTVSRVIKTIEDAKILALEHSDIDILLNEDVIKGLQNLIETYSEAGEVKDSLSTLTLDLIDRSE